MERRLVLVLALLVAAIQWPLWLGQGGWFKVWELRRHIDQNLAENEVLRQHNEAMVAEIASLRQGAEAIEERARGELSMVRADETFFQFLPAAALPPRSSEMASNDPLKFGVE